MGARLKQKVKQLKDGVIIFPETHAGSSGTNEILDKFDGKGWKAVVPPSVKNRRNKLAGDIAMAARRRLAVPSMRHLARKEDQAVSSTRSERLGPSTSRTRSR